MLFYYYQALFTDYDFQYLKTYLFPAIFVLGVGSLFLSFLSLKSALAFGSCNVKNHTYLIADNSLSINKLHAVKVSMNITSVLRMKQ